MTSNIERLRATYLVAIPLVASAALYVLASATVDNPRADYAAGYSKAKTFAYPVSSTLH